MNSISTEDSKQTQKALSPAFQRVMKRLNGLAEKYFTVRLEFIARPDKPEVSPGETSLAILKDGQTWGWLRAHGLQSQKDQERLEQMVDLLLTPTLEHWESHESLNKLEENLNRQQVPKNVIHLDVFRATKSAAPQASAFALKNSLPFRSAQRSVFVSHPEADQRFRQAKMFHEECGGYAFLPLESLDAQLFNSIDDFCALGDVTFYVSEVAHLTAPVQNFIAKAMVHQRFEERPHFVIGSEFSIYNSQLECLVTPELLALLKKSARPESFLLL